MTSNTRTNPNLKLSTESHYHGLPVLTHRGPLVTNYLDSIKAVYDTALSDYSRLFIVRFDLHFPLDYTGDFNTNVISRFFDSLRDKIAYEERSKAAKGVRCHATKVRYIWVREQSNNQRPHYHVVLLLNGDRFNGLGRTDSSNTNLANRITRSWAYALKVPEELGVKGVRFLPDCCYRVDSCFGYHHEILLSLFRRTSYFAKLTTKVYGTPERSFGCSNG
ncbi:MAG: inovirus Gp2 family protein [Idiomarina sp.]